MKVRDMTNNHRSAPNQYEITLDNGDTVFQSHNSVIATKKRTHSPFGLGYDIITLDKNYWDYSKTTGKYRNQFLGETKKETERKIKEGIYTLENLN